MQQKPSLEEPEYQWLEDAIQSLVVFGLSFLWAMIMILKNLVVAVFNLIRGLM